MSFSSQWDEVTGDKEGVDIDASAGAHSPPWDDMSQMTQELIQVATRAAENIIGELTEPYTDPRRYRVNLSGHLSEGDDTKSGVSLSIQDITNPKETAPPPEAVAAPAPEEPQTA